MTEHNRILECTREDARQGEIDRRREPREKIADLERRLAKIVELLEEDGLVLNGRTTGREVYRLAKGL